MVHRTRIAGLIVALALLALLAQPGPARAAGFTLTPSQPVVGAGETITFNGTGFTPGEKVATWITTPDQAVIGGDNVFAKGADGQITIFYHVPGAAISGRWAMTAYGIQSKTPVVANFDVNGQPPESVAPQAAVEPAVGPPGARFAFSALGFSKKEKVSYWFTGPDGQIHDAHPEGDKANDHGRVNILWQSPRDAIKGVWVITIQGIKSDKARAVPFEIR